MNKCMVMMMKVFSLKTHTKVHRDSKKYMLASKSEDMNTDMYFY